MASHKNQVLTSGENGGVGKYLRRKKKAGRIKKVVDVEGQA